MRADHSEAAEVIKQASTDSQARLQAVNKWQTQMWELNDEDQVRCAPNRKFYAIWRGQPICVLDGGLLYFETDAEAWQFLYQCNAENDLAYLGELEATVIPKKESRQPATGLAALKPLPRGEN